MSNRSRARRSGATAGRAGASQRARSPASAAAEPLATREAVDLREETVDLREETVDLREEAATVREEAATVREKALRPQEQSARATAALSELTQAQLREANELLVVASINAQTLAEQMSYMAEHDFLTGLPNRSLLTDRLTQAIALAGRHGKEVALMYLDLDHFKHVNDSLGHTVADQLLQSVAKRLQACVRVSDTVSRQGGDEFVVLLPEVDGAHGAALTAEKLIEAMAAPHLVDNHQLYVTMSIGISLFPDDGKDVGTVLRNADNAMHVAKRNGRNKFEAFTPDMNARAVARQSVELALHHALEHREFVLHYQPQVHLGTGAVTGAEALLRLQLADHRLVYPAQFVSIAEDCGLIVAIGRWVLREACRQTQTWLQAGLDLGRIAVNVSARELHSKDYLPAVRNILQDTGLDPRHLELELTESGFMQDAQQAATTLHALKDLGVELAVDDFGTGYSSLSHLRRFPIDTLKIDQSFVQDIDGAAGEAIVSAVIAMGMSLKQRVVAEGIETPQQVAFLQSRHCAEGQGFIFSQPVAAAEFPRCWASNGHPQ